jgi:regulatory protein
MPPRAPRLLDAAGLYDYAVRLLAGRAHAAGEMRLKLRRRAASPADVEAALERLAGHGYLDDARFAESYAAARLEGQGMGARRVLRDLRARRVAPATAERAVHELYGKIDEDELAAEWLRRKYRGRAEPFAEPRETAAAWGRLLRAGFSSGAAARALKSFGAGAELVDSLEPPDEPPGDTPDEQP